MPLAPGFKLKSGREETRYHLPEGFARIACDLSARLPRWRGAVARGCAWGIVWDPHAAAMIMAGLTPAYGIGLDQSYDSGGSFVMLLLLLGSRRSAVFPALIPIVFFSHIIKPSTLLCGGFCSWLVLAILLGLSLKDQIEPMKRDHHGSIKTTALLTPA
ncbi:hypothetical protein BD779DRAFT_436998 [Infundibulicybe gibba]|nr:hypothetical protein BD779DRAFT_436998 [Infundibulicybe gibba]